MPEYNRPLPNSSGSPDDRDERHDAAASPSPNPGRTYGGYGGIPELRSTSPNPNAQHDASSYVESSGNYSSSSYNHSTYSNPSSYDAPVGNLSPSPSGGGGRPSGGGNRPPNSVPNQSGSPDDRDERNNNNNSGSNYDSGFGGGRPSQVGNNGRLTGRVPVLIDLEGNGFDIDTLSSSSFFAELNGDGKQTRMAWAGDGTGVLVIDADGDGRISEEKEFAFTKWDQSAASDLEAVKNVFDTNHNGRLDAGDARWSEFKVWVNGSLVSLASLGIASIDLTPAGSGQTFADGSAITGTTTYTRTDGTIGAVGDAVLASDDASYLVAKQIVTNANGSTTTTVTARHDDGSIAFRNIVTKSADGRHTVTQFDDDGNGTVDRSRTDGIMMTGARFRIRALVSFGADRGLDFVNKGEQRANHNLPRITE